jgi:translation initiation factor 3 subunit B
VDAQAGVENVLVVDNLPIVDESKRQRLVERLRQVFEKAGAGIDEDRLSMPWDNEKGTNKGYVVACFQTQHSALCPNEDVGCSMDVDGPE